MKMMTKIMMIGEERNNLFVFYYKNKKLIIKNRATIDIFVRK
jgi:hypothetical protein